MTGKAGILVLEGSTLTLTNIGFSIDRTSGEVVAKPIIPLAQVDFWPHRLHIAVEQLPLVRRARSGLLGKDGEAEVRALEDEVRAAMTSLAATAFAVEAFATGVRHHASIDRHVGRNASTSRRIAEVLRRAFTIGSESFNAVRRVLVPLFRVRKLAVHPPAELQEFHPHPVTAAVPAPFAAFRLENAEESLNFVFDMLVWCTSSPRASRPRSFHAWCERQQLWVQPLLDRWAQVG